MVWLKIVPAHKEGNNFSMKIVLLVLVMVVAH